MRIEVKFRVLNDWEERLATLLGGALATLDGK